MFIPRSKHRVDEFGLLVQRTAARGTARVASLEKVDRLARRNGDHLGKVGFDARRWPHSELFIERVTSGRISRATLRPDVFGVPACDARGGAFWIATKNASVVSRVLLAHAGAFAWTITRSAPDLWSKRIVRREWRYGRAS